MMRGVVLIAFLAIQSTFFLSAQVATVEGIIIDQDGEALEYVNIVNKEAQTGVITDENGKYSIQIVAEKPVTLIFSFVGFKIQERTIKLKEDQIFKFNIKMEQNVIIMDVIDVIDKEVRNNVSMQRIDPRVLEFASNIEGGIEGILKTLGATSSNELSSTYSVRGGNFDENLVYVNDFEIYRPFLVRAGQQEGLSFINSNLISNILFSSGGFQPKYGDKMSSVLDIRYKKPREFAGSVAASLLGASMHLEGSAKNTLFKYLVGIRQKTNQYVLNSLPTKGEYRPSFTDLQALLNYELSTEVEVEWLTNYSRNIYRFIPEDRSTTFGVINTALQLDVFFDGKEEDRFENITNGISLTYKPNNNLRLKWLASSFFTSEFESIDIMGDYWIGVVETNFSREEFGEVVYGLGSGTEHNWSRNYLTALVNNAEHKGYFSVNSHYLQWGLKYQHERIEDEINEWVRIDSAGFSIPYNSNDVRVNEVLKTKIELVSDRYTTYFQDTWSFSDTSNFTLTYGSRLSYWSVNKELLPSPRLQLSYRLPGERDFVIRAASGIYNQLPFYRELRSLDGTINRKLKAQKSVHFVLGTDYNLDIWGRPFKWVTEVYYKH
ncbi:MAG: TonB-dependent receptor, partial [Bacteroidetes bacterium]|nr:TonB-dependent receptor [Bacteroidota bacterium]